MALLILEAFGAAQTTVELLRRFPGADTTVTGTTWVRGRQGGRAWSGVPGTGTQGVLETAPFPATTELIVGAVVRARALAAPGGVFRHLFSFRDGSGEANALCRIAWGPEGHVDGADDFELELRRGPQAADDTNILIAKPFKAFKGDRWSVIEARVDITAGEYELRVNGLTVLEGVGNIDHIDTGQITRFALGFRISADPDTRCWIDSFYVIDPTQPGANDFLGDTISESLLPEADGSLNEWIPSAGDDHYAMVDEPDEHDVDATYLRSSGEGLEERFQKPELERTRGGIVAAQQQINARLEGSGSKDLQAIVARGETSVAETAQSVTTSDYSLFRFGDNDPQTDAAWLQHHFNDSELGLRTP